MRKFQEYQVAIILAMFKSLSRRLISSQIAAIPRLQNSPKSMVCLATGVSDILIVYELLLNAASNGKLDIVPQGSRRSIRLLSAASR